MSTQPIAPAYDLFDKTVLITGASGGISRATALAPVDCGADLILLARGEEGLAQARSEIEQRRKGRRVRTCSVDLTDTPRTRELIMRLSELDALVNNAETNIPQKFDEVGEDSFEAIFDLNMKAAFLSPRPVCPSSVSPQYS